MKLQLHDNGLHLRFAPLTLTRPLGNLRMGIFTNDERWKLFLPDAEVSFITESYLQAKYPLSSEYGIQVNAQIIPNEDVVASICHLEADSILMYNSIWIAKTGNATNKIDFIGEEPIVLENRWHIYQKNDAVLKADFQLITNGRVSQTLSDTNIVIGDESLIFLEEGAVVEASILNTKTGPIYIGKDAEIMEGSVVRGPLAMCEHSALKLATKVYGAVTLGPHCKVGGEVNNVVFQAYSNKGHDGFLGNALIGEWCNLGADTNTSNLKNNYGNVSTYSFETGKEEKTDIQFMGVCMGDHSKCGINTMFNTATVVGVSSNVYGSGFPDKYVPSFSWGEPSQLVPFRFDKAIEYSNNMMNRRGLELSEAEISILKTICEK
ncbi:MAG: glucose-1-phosphate thymidylyltransferase [Fluviicola sp.]|jgi:UDP-N-acetylglucosamine diphosphorylase/glucosamine-1-phosphate N-acetyltransferase|nr:glucose-1-phosphate thymidylyltransferase [Fluviicola sp.]